MISCTCIIVCWYWYSLVVNHDGQSELVASEPYREVSMTSHQIQHNPDLANCQGPCFNQCQWFGHDIVRDMDDLYMIGEISGSIELSGEDLAALPKSAKLTLKGASGFVKPPGGALKMVAKAAVLVEFEMAEGGTPESPDLQVRRCRLTSG